MSTKNTRSGGKYGGGHTTMIPAAIIVADIVERQPEVSRISPGILKAGLKSANGQRRVKISDWEGGILLSVRDNTTHQEVRVYTSNSHVTKLAIARGARNAGLHISFGNLREFSSRLIK
ncbi:MAG: DUF2103 domain-containing protein [Candidatus Wolfebacteria bacterium]|nr:DUF2103 domain-containing protein [Candidatus Wolfebacteria bacterium]